MAVKWLKGIGCKVTISEMASAAQEEPDAIGWRSGVSILVECKTSQNDFKKDAHKFWRRMPEYGMGDWRFYMCEKDVILPNQLPENWGLIYIINQKTKLIVGPKGNASWGKRPFKANQQHEIRLLVSALSRKTRTYHE